MPEKEDIIRDIENNRFVMKSNLKQKARRELHEIDEEVPKCLEQLRTILSEEEPSLRLPLNEKFLFRFLRARKFDVSKAKSLVRNYYDMRHKNEEIFRDLYPESIVHVLNQEIQEVLKSRDAEGRQVFIFRAGKWNPDIVNLDDIFRTNYLILEEMTASEETQVNGVTAIVDFQGMGFYQARQFTPKHAIRMVQIIQNSFPCRFQEFHLINQPYLFKFLYAVVKPFLSEKIRNRIHFHGQDLLSLHKQVEPTILPDYLGGNVKHDPNIFNLKLLRNNEHYKDMLQYGYDKSDS